MHHDTIALLGDCTANIHRAVSTMDNLLPQIHDRQLRQALQQGLLDLGQLHKQARLILTRYGANDRTPGTMAQSMARLRLDARMALRSDDTTIADLVADRCDLGVRSLSKSRNRCAMATEEALDLTGELIRCQARLSAGLRQYL